jgi:hypothetical protein
MPSEQKMLFFTRDLYRRYNSADDEVALAADAEWEAAIVRYHQHLSTLRETMPSQIIELSELCLHDGEILQRKEEQHPLDLFWFDRQPGSVAPFFWYGLATVAIRLDDELVTLFYFLCDHMAQQPAPKDWPFSKERAHWLYDEVHPQKGHPGRFVHLVLLSSGVVMTIPFVSVLISRFSLSGAESESKKQTA